MIGTRYKVKNKISTILILTEFLCASETRQSRLLFCHLKIETWTFIHHFWAVYISHSGNFIATWLWIIHWLTLDPAWWYIASSRQLFSLPALFSISYESLVFFSRSSYTFQVQIWRKLGRQGWYLVIAFWRYISRQFVDENVKFARFLRA